MRDNRRNDWTGGTFFVIRRFFPRDAELEPRRTFLNGLSRGSLYSSRDEAEK
jgi:hypothetical protein